MLAEQRIVGAVMVEPVGRKNLFPAAGDVAARAIAAEANYRADPCGTTMQYLHIEILYWTGLPTAAGAGRWHLSHSTFACSPVSG